MNLDKLISVTGGMFGISFLLIFALITFVGMQIDVPDKYWDIVYLVVVFWFGSQVGKSEAITKNEIRDIPVDKPVDTVDKNEEFLENLKELIETK